MKTEKQRIHQIIIFISILVLIMGRPSYSDDKVKQPNVSGQFYTADSQKLSMEIDQYLKNADIKGLLDKPIEVILVPHAGYMYSGAVAAHSFKAIRAQNYKTVVILGFSHSVGFKGISIWPEGAFRTPLGDAVVDQEFAVQLLNFHPNIFVDHAVFDDEHSLEVEIPFIQKTLPDAKIVPVMMGQPSMQTMDAFAKRLAQLVGNRTDVLIVVSTDLSHYHDDKFARPMDEKTMNAIAKIDLEGLAQGHQSKQMELCGLFPVVTSMFYARARGITETKILRYANSGDVMSDKKRVVGYGSIIYFRKSADQEKDSGVAPLSKEQKKRLLEIAKLTIDQYLRTGKKLEVKEADPRLSQSEGAFVTIHKNGDLRGCIGNIIGRGPLYLTVRDMAISAATEDPRFQPMTKDEIPQTDVEVSVLSTPRVAKADEIEMGKHGVIISRGMNHGVFLPQVATETGWSKDEFMSQLCSQKAGLPHDCWKDPATKIEIFTADVFSEHDLM
jgi:AmmeMemoRadiSam system protein B/AmmeMemoRadiSam system protein A